MNQRIAISKVIQVARMEQVLWTLVDWNYKIVSCCVCLTMSYTFVSCFKCSLVFAMCQTNSSVPKYHLHLVICSKPYYIISSLIILTCSPLFTTCLIVYPALALVMLHSGSRSAPIPIGQDRSCELNTGL